MDNVFTAEVYAGSAERDNRRARSTGAISPVKARRAAVGWKAMLPCESGGNTPEGNEGKTDDDGRVARLTADVPSV